MGTRLSEINKWVITVTDMAADMVADTVAEDTTVDTVDTVAENTTVSVDTTTNTAAGMEDTAEVDTKEATDLLPTRHTPPLLPSPARRSERSRSRSSKRLSSSSSRSNASSGDSTSTKQTVAALPPQ